MVQPRPSGVNAKPDDRFHRDWNSDFQSGTVTDRIALIIGDSNVLRPTLRMYMRPILEQRVQVCRFTFLATCHAVGATARLDCLA